MVRIVTRKPYKVLSEVTPWKLKQFLPSHTWLYNTVKPDGFIRNEFKTIIAGLDHLNSSPSKVGQIEAFRLALKNKNFDQASSIWNNLNHIQLSDLSALQYKWCNLKTLPYYGPPLLTNALNDLCRHIGEEPMFVTSMLLLNAQDHPLMPYYLGYVMKNRGARNFDFCLKLLLSSDKSPESQCIGTTALLESVNMKPILVKQVLEKVKLPSYYKFPDRLVHALYDHCSDPEIVDLFKHIVPFLNPRSKALDKLLRGIYKYSDRGALEVVKYAGSGNYPFSIIPFLNKRLCVEMRNSVLSGDKNRIESSCEIWKEFFNNVTKQIPAKKNVVVLNTLLTCTFSCYGFETASPILEEINKTNSEIPLSTWLIMMGEFRRTGRPDKCIYVLENVLKRHPALPLPFLGEYLLFVGSFFNFRHYFKALTTLVPEIEPILEQLHIKSFVLENLMHFKEEYTLMNYPLLTPQNREINVSVDNIHFTFINITYKVLLSIVQNIDTVQEMFMRYIELVESSSNSTVNMDVIDLFIKSIISPTTESGIFQTPFDERVDRALRMLVTAYQRIGRNISYKASGTNTLSLKYVCRALTRVGRPKDATKLFLYASEVVKVPIKHTTLSSWVTKLSKELQDEVLATARNKHNALIDMKSLSI